MMVKKGQQNFFRHPVFLTFITIMVIVLVLRYFNDNKQDDLSKTYLFGEDSVIGGKISNNAEKLTGCDYNGKCDLDEDCSCDDCEDMMWCRNNDKVTYEGVLEMFNSCDSIVNQASTLSCDYTCESRNQKCALVLKYTNEPSFDNELLSEKCESTDSNRICVCCSVV